MANFEKTDKISLKPIQMVFRTRISGICFIIMINVWFKSFLLKIRRVLKEWKNEADARTITIPIVLCIHNSCSVKFESGEQRLIVIGHFQSKLILFIYLLSCIKFDIYHISDWYSHSKIETLPFHFSTLHFKFIHKEFKTI